MEREKVYAMPLSKVYPLLVKKVEKKGHTEQEVIHIIKWLTGYNETEINLALEEAWSYEMFFKKAPQLNPCRKLIKGVVCGVRVENMEEGLMQEIRYLDKLIDELAKGKSMDKILRK